MFGDHVLVVVQTERVLGSQSHRDGVADSLAIEGFFDLRENVFVAAVDVLQIAITLVEDVAFRIGDAVAEGTGR
jgi:MOSC domain-containing protein YiiM